MANPPTDEESLAGAREAMAELEALFAKVRESLEARRYVEANGWLDGAEDILEGAQGELGLLAAGQVISTVRQP